MDKKFQSFIGKSKQGYAVLIVGVLFAVGMVVVSTQIARQTVDYQRAVGSSLEENIQERFSVNIANKVLSRLMQFRSGYYELGKVLDFTSNGADLRDALELPKPVYGNGNADVVMEYDFYGASVVPVPTAYSFDEQNYSNSLIGPEIVDPDARANAGEVALTKQADLGFYTGDFGALCDPSANYDKGTGDYNIFKRASDGKNFLSVAVPNFQCGNVGLRRVTVADSYRSTSQMVVTNNPKERQEEARFYYTVPALGTGDAGTECVPHQVEFGAKWNGSDEFIDPLDHPCNWNVMEKGETVKFGLSSFNKEQILEKTAGNVGWVGSLALTGSNLEQDVQRAFEQSYYDGFDQNDTLILRIRLRCADGSSNCHPVERYEFFDSEFLNEFSGDTHAECDELDANGNPICNHTYRQLAKHSIESPEFDFTKLVFGYGLSDEGRFLPMRGDYNLERGRENRLFLIKNSALIDYRSPDLLEDARTGPFSTLSLAKLRGDYVSSMRSLYATKSSRSQLSNDNLSDYSFGYDPQSKISNVLVNKLEFPYQEQGFGFDYSDYYHLYLLDTEGQDDLKNPEFVLQSIDDFLEVVNRKLYEGQNYTPRTFTRLEYQLVSDKIIGIDEGYIVYDFGFGNRMVKNKYETSGVVDTGFVNVSN